jgi:hypothetical protein
MTPHRPVSDEYDLGTGADAFTEFEDRVLAKQLAPVLGRDPAEVRGRVCVGTTEHCVDLLAHYAAASCERVHVWPIGDEAAQQTDRPAAADRTRRSRFDHFVYRNLEEAVTRLRDAVGLEERH